MARIFVGLVKCGAWGCFDEFNRLEEATLSAISMQIQPIQTALKFGYRTVKLMDEEVSNRQSDRKFKVCKSMHHHTIQINHQPDATIFQFIILTFIYSSTCFGHFPTHHQELNDCSGSL
jgi:hypothetical protein